MTDGRERDIVRAFVDLSHALVEDYDVVDMLERLTANCVELLDVSSAGLLLADPDGVLHVVASSSAPTHHLEVFQLQRDEGPCLDCFRAGEPVVVPDLGDSGHRWPQFTRAARAVGIVSVHAVPMRLRSSVLGTLGLFGGQVGRLGEEDLSLAQSLVHVASVAIVNEKSSRDLATINAQLQHALTSRIVLEQAKGVLAHTGDLDMDTAFAVLRRYARDHGRRLSDVAADLVSRSLPGDALLRHARSVSLIS